jgi:mRNA interferase MazF
MQTSPYNRSSLRTVVGVAVTTDRRLAAMPGNVLLPASVTGLSEDSVADVTQVATVDRRHLDERVGAVPPWLLADVERGLRRVLGL